MRVLHLPVNVASAMSHTVRGLRRSQVELEVWGLSFGDSAYDSGQEIQVVSSAPRQQRLQWLGRRLVFARKAIEMIRWADVLHWYFGAPFLPAGLDLRYVKFLGKPGLVEWLGSEIRVPEVEFADNPYYQAAYSRGYEYAFENRHASYRLQREFARAGFASVVSAGMYQYLDVSLWRKIYSVPQRIVLSDYEPAYPDPGTTRPLVVHSPTAPIAKGTPVVLQVIEKLKQKYEFDFQLITNLSRAQALELVRRADIFVDQLVIGHYGMAAVEAMAYGKPVICYIKPSLVTKFPPDCPIVNASQDTLETVLAELLGNTPQRQAVGQRSRQYVEKHHDAVQQASQLMEIYRELIGTRQATGAQAERRA